MRKLVLTFLAMGIVLTAGNARAERYARDHCRSAHGQKCIHPHHAGRAATVGWKYRRAVPYNQFNEPYYGASQGYAPGEKQQFLESVMRRD